MQKCGCAASHTFTCTHIYLIDHMVREKNHMLGCIMERERQKNATTKGKATESLI
jgi:hypothetical protein